MYYLWMWLSCTLGEVLKVGGVRDSLGCATRLVSTLLPCCFHVLVAISPKNWFTPPILGSPPTPNLFSTQQKGKKNDATVYSLAGNRTPASCALFYDKQKY